jgi:hypothetical protein
MVPQTFQFHGRHGCTPQGCRLQGLHPAWIALCKRCRDSTRRRLFYVVNILRQSRRIFTPSRETHRILTQAKAIGPATEQLCQSLFDSEGRVGQRRLWGIVGLARRYPRRLVDQACAMALHAGVRSYKQIQALTERLLKETLAAIDAPVQGELALTQDHPLIRGGDDYADLFTLGAQQSAALPPTLEESLP